MSGSNSNMTLVMNVAKDLDGSDSSLSPYTWTCPDVNPYSIVYFYQFTAAPAKSDPAWTTRFTVCVLYLINGLGSPLNRLQQITSPAGETTVPSHGKQPNGDDVPWGVGVLRSGSSVAAREKHSGSSSTGEEDSDESYSNDEEEDTNQRSSNSKAKEGTEDDEEASSTRTSSKKGSSGSGRMSNEDSEDSEVLEDDTTSSSTKSGSSKSALKDTEEGSNDSDAVDSTNDGSDSSLTSAEGEESGLEDAVSTSSRLKTVHSKPTSTLSMGNVNAATPTLPLPSAPPSSAQPVGCAGGVNATSSYCSTPSSTNHATYLSKLDSRTLFVTVLVFSFGLLQLE